MQLLTHVLLFFATQQCLVAVQTYFLKYICIYFYRFKKNDSTPMIFCLKTHSNETYVFDVFNTFL